MEYMKSVSTLLDIVLEVGRTRCLYFRMFICSFVVTFQTMPSIVCEMNLVDDVL